MRPAWLEASTNKEGWFRLLLKGPDTADGTGTQGACWDARSARARDELAGHMVQRWRRMPGCVVQGSHVVRDPRAKSRGGTGVTPGNMKS